MAASTLGLGLWLAGSVGLAQEAKPAESRGWTVPAAPAKGDADWSPVPQPAAAPPSVPPASLPQVSNPSADPLLPPASNTPATSNSWRTATPLPGVVADAAKGPGMLPNLPSAPADPVTPAPAAQPIPATVPTCKATAKTPTFIYQQASMQGQGQQDTAQPGEESPEYQIQLEPPGPERIFRLESERTLQERMRQEARGRPTLERISFPEEPVLSKEPYTPRVLPPSKECVEAAYVCYRRLYFEQINSERYGWDLGFIDPIVSAGVFYWDVITLPYHIWTEPCRKFECSAGYCLPGDPVPLLLYPPELSLTGAAAEGGTIVALFAIFPG